MYILYAATTSQGLVIVSGIILIPIVNPSVETTLEIW